MKLLIIGGGIGGLTTGIALSQQGFEVEIFEAAPEIKPVGAGIVLADNALAVFKNLGFFKAFENAGCKIEEGNITNEKLKSIRQIETPGLSFCLHRAELHRILAENLGKAKLHLNKRFVAYKQLSNQKVEAQFEDGSSAIGDLLIGADGIHSPVRQQLNPKSKMRYSGQTCWRGVLDFELPNDFKNKAFEAWGGKVRFGFVEYASGKIYWYAVLTSPQGGSDEKANLKSKLLGYFSDFHPIANELIKETEVSKIHRADLFDLAPSSAKWYGKNVCLIGDAAHATTPNLGQGACQAIEDAYALAKAFEFFEKPEQAFAWYQKKRHQKTIFVVENSWQVGKTAHWENAFLRFFRDLMFKMVPKSIALKHLQELLDLSYLQKK